MWYNDYVLLIISIMNGLSKLSNNAKKVLKFSYNEVKKSNYSTLKLEHLLYALLIVDEGIASRVLKATGFDTLIEEKLAEFEFEEIEFEQPSSVINISDEFRKALENAYNIARNQYHVYVGTEHLLLGILKQKKYPLVSELAKAGLTYDYTEKYISSYANYPVGLLSKVPVQEEKSNSILPMLGRNLTEMVKSNEIDIILGREKEIDRIVHILERRSKNNPILIGEAGVGKTAIVEGLAQRIVKGEVPEDLKNAQVWAIDTSRLMASTEMRGDLEAKVMALIEEVSGKNNIILFIDEIHGIIGNGNGNDIGGILKPYLTRGVLKCIGATTLAEYQKFFEPDAALTRRFQSILVDEITEGSAIEILKNLKTELERYHKIKISDDAVVGAVKLSSRYITERYLPDKAIDVLDEAAAKLKLERQDTTPEMKSVSSEIALLQKEKEGFVEDSNYDKALQIRRKENELRGFLDSAFQTLKRTRTSTRYVVNEDAIRSVIARWTGIPVQTLNVNEKSSLKLIDKNIKKEIIGQDDAVSRVTHAIKSARLGIRNVNRPLASFLFLGPTGVGKTELAKQIALQLFGDSKALVQVDMSEYMESHTVSKFIGSPPGYIGFQEGGQLTEKIRRRPYSVILFDEIEKAHPDVLNILLQVLEEGHLTDAKGRVVNFKNTIVVLTSNIGASKIKDDKVLGFNIPSMTGENQKNFDSAYDKMRDIVLEEMKLYLTPEFINRLDDIIIFRGLNIEDISRIADKVLIQLKLRLRENRLNLVYDKAVVDFIGKKGFNKEYGARPLGRAVEEHIEFPLADALLQKELGKKAYNVKAEVVDDEVKITIIG